MASAIIKKRFIAGVVCPKCGEMDKIRMYRDEDDTELRDCVACGFTETYTQHKEAKEAATSEPLYEELTTRVTPVGKALYDEEEVPLKIMDPGLSRKDH
ncbi:MAG: YheV family putative zinc ribbon protein [Oleispira sp.]